MCYSNSYHCYDGAKLQYFYRPAKEMIRKQPNNAQKGTNCAKSLLPSPAPVGRGRSPTPALLRREGEQY